jgi:hypothetical protein
MTKTATLRALSVGAAVTLPLLFAAPAFASGPATEPTTTELTYCLTLPTVTSGGTTVFPGARVCVPSP